MYHEEAFYIEAKNYEIYERDVYFTHPPKLNDTLQGEERLRRFENIIFNGYHYKPHKFQQGFLKEAVKGLAELLVGPEDWRTIGPSIIQQRGWTTMSKMILAKAPRRFGKSMAVGMIVIAYAAVMPGSVVCIISSE